MKSSLSRWVRVHRPPAFFRESARLSAGVCFALLLSACGEVEDSEGTLIGDFRDVADFKLVSEDGETFSRDAVRGKVWIANFIFTSCSAECLVLSSRVARMQALTRGYEDIMFVSFSVDPETDTPDRLKAYAKRWHADPGRWRMLTGRAEEVDDLVINSFLLPVTRDPLALGKLYSESLIHSNRFAIVDRSGKVRAYVDGLPEGSVDTVLRIALQLRDEPDRSTGSTLSDAPEGTALAEPGS